MIWSLRQTPVFEPAERFAPAASGPVESPPRAQSGNFQRPKQRRILPPSRIHPSVSANHCRDGSKTSADTELLGETLERCPIPPITGDVDIELSPATASLRGLTVALIERADFGSGASAHSLKVLRGGIGYLQHLDIPRLRESCAERTAFMRIAPHLTRPLPFALPTFGHGFSPSFKNEYRNAFFVWSSKPTRAAILQEAIGGKTVRMKSLPTMSRHLVGIDERLGVLSESTLVLESSKTRVANYSELREYSY
jgi:hypothetical protein